MVTSVTPVLLRDTLCPLQHLRDNNGRSFFYCIVQMAINNVLYCTLQYAKYIYKVMKTFFWSFSSSTLSPACTQSWQTPHILHDAGGLIQRQIYLIIQHCCAEDLCVHVSVYISVCASRNKSTLVLFEEIARATRLRTISLMFHLEKQNIREGKGKSLIKSFI